MYTRLHDREIRRDAQQLERTFDQTGRNMGNNLSAGIDRATPKIEQSMARVEKATDKVADAMGNVRREQARYDDLVSRGDASRTQLITQSERLAKARRSEASAIRDATRVHRDYDRDLISISGTAHAATSAISGMGSAAGSAASSLSGLGGSLGSLTKGAGSGATIGAVVTLAMAATDALVDVGKAVVTATQSLWLLPAAAAAAGAGIGTLMIGLTGVEDTLKNLRDPKKFAESIQALAPNAQQAVLSIQALLPAWDKLTAATQNAMFEGVGEQINRLANQYLPTLQTMTSSIAGSFNQMFQGVTDALMANPDLVNNVAGNISAAFQNIAQSAGPLTTALAKVVSVGSDFLPGLADELAGAASELANFLTTNSENGNIKRWIEDGIAAAKELGNTIFGIGKVIYDAFGSAKPSEFKDTLDAIVTAAQTVTTVIKGIQSAWGFMANAATIGINAAINAVNNLLNPLRGVAQLLNALPGVDIQIPEGLIAPVGVPIAGTPVAAAGDISPSLGAGSGGGLAAGPNLGGGLGAATGGGGLGHSGTLATAGLGPSIGTPYPSGGYTVPGAPADGGRGGGPRLPDAPTVPYDPTVPGGSSPATFAAETSYLDARQKLAEKRARLDQLDKSAVATEQDKLKARNDVIEAERDMQGAEIRLNEARVSQFEKMTKTGDKYASRMGEIGAQLDQDFGISKGLSGIAENITKFVANLAAAPLLGQLDAISQANPSKGGYGAMGVLAAQGAFGPQYTGVSQQGYGYAASAMGPAGLRPGAFGSDAALLANVPAGRYSNTGAADLTKGLGDCSSAVEDLVNLMDGRPTGGRSMSTGNADSWLQSRGFMPGTGGPGDMRVAFNSGHMQATLPGGTPFNWGSDAAAARGGVGGTGAADPALTSHYYRPAGVQMPIPTVADIYSPANTNPALTPAAPSLAGVPSMPGGMMPGMGAPSAAPFANTQYGGITPSGGSGQGGVGMSGGGALGMAMDAGGMALDLMAPGAGQAAQTGMKLANRAIQYGGQVAGIGAQGLMETFLPFGASELANNNWLTRIVGGLAGAAPAIPNAAGKSSQPSPEQVANVDPNTTQHGQGANPGPGNTYNVQIDAANREPQGIAKDFEWHTSQANAGPGMG